MLVSHAARPPAVLHSPSCPAPPLQAVPLPPRLASEAVGFFLIVMAVGFTTIFLK